MIRLKVFLFVVISLTLNVLSAQTFTVVKIFGKITNNNVPVTAGDNLTLKEKLRFETDDSRARVFNSNKGGLEITANNYQSNSQTNFLLPSANVSTRGNMGSIEDIANYLTDRFLLLDEIEIKVGKKFLPMTDTSFFFLRFKYNSELVNKKLAFKGDTLIFCRSEILKIDNQPITSFDTPAVTLYYKIGQDFAMIAKFEMIMPDCNELQKELTAIFEGIKTQPVSVKKTEAEAYLSTFYAKPEANDFENWLNNNFNFK